MSDEQLHFAWNQKPNKVRQLRLHLYRWILAKKKLVWGLQLEWFRQWMKFCDSCNNKKHDSFQNITYEWILICEWSLLQEQSPPCRTALPPQTMCPSSSAGSSCPLKENISKIFKLIFKYLSLLNKHTNHMSSLISSVIMPPVQLLFLLCVVTPFLLSCPL